MTLINEFLGCIFDALLYRRDDLLWVMFMPSVLISRAPGDLSLGALTLTEDTSD